MWGTIAGNLGRYKSYPRIVGETGGKDFVFAHPSADARALVVALVRGAFEYQGQKCSAASRAYVPKSLWKQVESGLREEIGALRMGPPTDFRNFLCAVIDEASFDKTMGYVEHARQLVGGGDRDRRRRRQVRRLVRRADGGDDRGPALQADGGGDLRAGAHRAPSTTTATSTRRSSSATRPARTR